jgi:uncharacterized protein
VTAFVDASALVKLYVPEQGSEAVGSLEEPFVVSGLSRVEVASGLWRKHREGWVGLDEVAVLLAAFDADWNGSSTEPPRFVAVALDARVLDAAARQLAWYPVRAGDSVQLASATAARAVDPEISRFVTFDARLAAAAAAEGFEVVGTA